jgi:hypothetical protein
MLKTLTADLVRAYTQREISYLQGLMPQYAVEMSAQEVLHLLRHRLGETLLRRALDPYTTIESPLQKQGASDGTWLRSTNMVGINVRTVGSFWHAFKYCLTLPDAQNAVHLLPIWEPGVVASLYGMCSWNINPEFFSVECQTAIPHLDTPEKQLKAVVNLLHALGKTVGMDVIPHTDRYAEQVIANPRHFEWLRRRDTEIIDHQADLHSEVEQFLFSYLQKNYPNKADLPKTANDFFGNTFPESRRLEMLFGNVRDYQGRLARRDNWIQLLYTHHYETVPATMGPPYRGLAVDTQSEPITDARGRVWRDYHITKSEKFSRVFGPLARYRLYESQDDNRDWALDFERPVRAAWTYVAQHYAQVQAQYHFDFMRGDMAHVQMHSEGVPTATDEYYDILAYIKAEIAQKTPYFGSFAETFLAPDGEMAYGNEVAHLEKTAANSTLGDLQSMTVGSERFVSEFGRYLDILHTSSVAPNFTVMTADKDDPRFDAFYLRGNEIRLFIALFLTEMPSYMGLGFECRDAHPTPAPNEHYTKLYVFQERTGPKATHGDYIWGKNAELFDRLDTIRTLAEELLPEMVGAKTEWCIKPNHTNEHAVIAWQVSEYLFIANLDCLQKAQNINIPCLDAMSATLDFSTSESDAFLLPDEILTAQNERFLLTQLAAGAARVYVLS